LPSVKLEILTISKAGKTKSERCDIPYKCTVFLDRKIIAHVLL